MKQKASDQKLVMITMGAALVCALLVSGLFAVLYFQTVGETKPTAASVDTADAVELARLKNENEYLRAKLDAYPADTTAQFVTESPKQTEPPMETMPAIPPETYDPGDITPADPASLSYTFDLTKQAAIIKRLEQAMQQVPFIVAPDGTLMPLSELTFDEDTTIIYKESAGTGYDAEGQPLQREIDYAAMGYSFPTVALAYRDLERGTTYAYHADTVFFSASLIKVPYIYTLLEQFAKYQEIKTANPTNDPAVGSTLSDEILEKYDLSRKITITESMKAEGSGTIRDMDLSGEGKEFTISELIGYAIKVSDNTAFRVLRDEFGYDYFRAVSKQLGITSVFQSFNLLTVDEAIRYLSAIYDFAKTYPTEGGMLISLMKQANHTVMIPAALGNSSDVAHKYGWDSNSYHDMALVYGDAPYAVCVMTNFDFPRSDETINTYIRSLIRDVDALHKSFYEK